MWFIFLLQIAFGSLYCTAKDVWGDITHEKLEVMPVRPTYDLEWIFNISKSQTEYIVDSWKISKNGLSNAAISPYPSMEKDTYVVLWRIYDNRFNRDKIGFLTMQCNAQLPRCSTPTTFDYIEIFSYDGNRWSLPGEDARAFLYKNRLHIVYNTNFEHGHRRVYFSSIYYDKPKLAMIVRNSSIHLTIEHELGKHHQKNWSPFIYLDPTSPSFEEEIRGSGGRVRTGGEVSTSAFTQDYTDEASSFIDVHDYDDGSDGSPELLFIQSIVPHRVVAVRRYVRGPGEEDGTHHEAQEMKAHTVSLTRLTHVPWYLGELRGGTPAKLVNDHHYLVFFHSSGIFNHPIVTTYFMGAYLFQSRPPFAITHMTTQPIVAAPMYNESTAGWAWPKTDYVIFPMGFVLTDDGHILVSYGQNDKEGWIVKLKKTEFLQSLQPVHSEALGQAVWREGRAVESSFRTFNNFTTTANSSPRKKNRLRRKK